MDRYLPMPFAVDVHSSESETVLALYGELDLCTQPPFVEALTEAADSGISVVLDLSDLTFIDAGNIGLIYRAQARARSLGADVVLRDPNPRLFRILELTGLHTSDPYVIAS